MSLNDRRIPVVWTVVLVLLAAAGSALALTITSLEPTHVSVFSAGTRASDLRVHGYQVQLQGPDRIQVRLELRNAGSQPHRANVTVRLLDADETVLAGRSTETGSIDPGETWKTHMNFREDGLVRAFDASWIAVDQTG